MKRSLTLMRVLAVLLAAVVTLQVGAPQVLALPLSAAQIRIEVNATDGDAGIQIFVDGEGWATLEVFDPNGAKVVEVFAKNNAEQQGITELFFESAEPSFEDQTLEELFFLFPAGMYKFEAMTDEGQKLTGKANFTHAIPAGPEIISPEEGEVLDAGSPVVISWEHVTDPFPGTDLAVNVVAYQIIVEQIKPPSVHRVFSMTVPAATTQVTLPAELIQANGEYKFEVLAIEAGGNQTISESTFKTQ